MSELKEVKPRQRYRSKRDENELCTVNRVQRKGAGFQVIFAIDNYHALMCSRKQFLNEYELTK